MDVEIDNSKIIVLVGKHELTLTYFELNLIHLAKLGRVFDHIDYPNI